MEEYIGKHAKPSGLNLYVITEHHDVDGGFGDAISKTQIVGYVMATREEIDEYLVNWDRPRCYDVPYSELWEHHVTADIVEISNLENLIPYSGDPFAPHCHAYEVMNSDESVSPWD